jgi:hypothetical protein
MRAPHENRPSPLAAIVNGKLHEVLAIGVTAASFPLSERFGRKLERHLFLDRTCARLVACTSSAIVLA